MLIRQIALHAMTAQTPLLDPTQLQKTPTYNINEIMNYMDDLDLHFKWPLNNAPISLPSPSVLFQVGTRSKDTSGWLFLYHTLKPNELDQIPSDMHYNHTNIQPAYIITALFYIGFATKTGHHYTAQMLLDANSRPISLHQRNNKPDLPVLFRVYNKSPLAQSAEAAKAAQQVLFAALTTIRFLTEDIARAIPSPSTQGLYFDVDVPGHLSLRSNTNRNVERFSNYTKSLPLGSKEQGWMLSGDLEQILNDPTVLLQHGQNQQAFFITNLHRIQPFDPLNPLHKRIIREAQPTPTKQPAIVNEAAIFIHNGTSDSTLKHLRETLPPTWLPPILYSLALLTAKLKTRLAAEANMERYRERGHALELLTDVT